MNDPFPSTPEALLRRMRALRSLVVALLGSEDGAEDLVHDLWIASRTKRPARTKSVWAWLAGMARLEVLQLRRRERRRAAREHVVARPEAIPPERDASERIELSRLVIEELQRLQEPYAQALWLHYFEDLPPREIAARAGVPPETMRTRLHRARQRLRERLEARCGRGDGWRAAVAPLAASSASGIGGAIGTSTLVTVGAVMKTKAVLVAALVLGAASAGWLAWHSIPSRTPPSLPLPLRWSENAREEAPGKLAPSDVVRSARAEERNEERGDPTLAVAEGAGVLVIDAAERPVADVPVAVISRKFEQEVELWSGRTDVRGFALFPTDLAARVPAHLRGAVVATLGFPTVAPVDASFEEGQPLEKPLVLRLPPTGSVALRFVDEQGRTATEVKHAHLCGTSPADIASARTHWQSLLTTDLELKDGCAVVRRVGLGCRLHVASNYPEGTRARVEMEFDGPTQAGQCVEVLVPLGPRVPVLIGRWLDESGRPLAKTSVSIWLQELQQAVELTSLSTTLESDSEGRFRFAAWAGQPPRDGSSVRLVLTGRDELRDARVSVELPSVAAGEIDLGDIVLRIPPLRLSGIVRDRGGRPQAGISLEIRCSTPDPMARAERFSVSTDAAGRFAWRGDGAWTQAHLDLRRENGDRLLLPTRTVTLGTAEALALEIEIAETSGLRGSVLRDELAFETRLCVHAMNAEGRIWRHFLFSRDDEFELELRPGTYRCWLEASGFELFYRKEVEAGVLAVVEASEVIVREGEMARDPRLQAIDLRGRFRKLRGVLLDASGEPVRRQRFRLAPLVAGVLLGAYQVETDRDGRFAATCLREHTSFLLSFGGFRPIELAWQPEEQVVRCAEGIRVQLELAADAPALPPGFELEACLSPLGFPSTDLASAIGVGADFCSVVRDGRCELRVPIAGSYRVEWSLSFHTQGTWANSGRGENVVEIRDLGEPVRLVVAPAADAIERARRLLVEKR